MSLPLSKLLDPADFVELAEELAIVDRRFHLAAEQHPMRRWEYAMALRAIRIREQIVTIAYDIGGAGSPFQYMWGTQVVDPNDGGLTLAMFIHDNPRLADVVTCLSVLEHVDDLDQFCYHLSCLVAPGGLLFLTMDACACPSHAADLEVADPPDRHHFHWMRKRMFGRVDRRALAERFLALQFSWLGDCDFMWCGAHVYDYAFASLALVKRP